MKCPLCYYREENQADLVKKGIWPQGGAVYYCQFCGSTWRELAAKLVGGVGNVWEALTNQVEIYTMTIQLLEKGDQMKIWEEEDRKKGGCGSDCKGA